MSLFETKSLKQRLEEASALLKEYGYRVQEPPLKRASVTTVRQLVRFFYDCMQKYNSNFRFACSPSSRRDLTLATRFVKSRMETGINKERALAESCEIIEAMFEFEEFLGLSQPITSMAILGQGNMAWVTEKAVQICNRRNKKVQLQLEEVWFEGYNKQQAVRELTEVEHESVVKDLDSILRKYDEASKTKDSQEK